MEYNFTLADLFKAYFECRKNKRCKKSALQFELHLEQNLLKLYKEIKSGKYKIGKCICFVVTRPKPREVWAANFRDRIVHHLIYNFVRERFYKRFIHDTYSCIPKRGTLAAAKRLLHFSRSATNNYTKKMFYLKADLSNFFVSIDKDILFGLIKKHVDEEWILSLIQQIIYNDPVQNVYKKSSARKFRLIPHYKSLFNADKQHGLPIGNLTSQFFSNVYLDVMDQYIKRELKCRYYLRYVDDFVIIGEDTWFLNECFRRIREYIARELNITLHPRKKLINKVENGIDFVGFFVLPHRVFLRKQTIYKIVCCIKEWKKKYNPYQNQILEKFFRSINSYLGMLVNLNSFNLRFIFTTKLNSLFICSDILFSKCCIKVY
ncbi:reverse transcriptase [bacterium]|nr:reverse transcriptase [bacterium]